MINPKKWLSVLCKSVFSAETEVVLFLDSSRRETADPAFPHDNGSG